MSLDDCPALFVLIYHALMEFRLFSERNGGTGTGTDGTQTNPDTKEQVVKQDLKQKHDEVLKHGQSTSYHCHKGTGCYESPQNGPN